ncbi:MAG: hypothetical protein FJX11_20910 [Alphaproteobacteria bacterium]|nr:hypothetical protein [Alphaproteobacteria bacterium]
MDRKVSKAPAAMRPHRRLALTWVDVLVIIATILTFAAIASATVGRTKMSSASRIQTLATETSPIIDDPGLVKARIRLATGGPWGWRQLLEHSPPN